MQDKIQHNLIIPPHLGGLRLDQALAQLLPEFSRTQIQAWVKTGEITLNQRPTKSKEMVLGGESIEVNALMKAQPNWEAEPIQLEIIYEDEALLVINKARGMVVHPAAGNHQGTLLNALIHHAPALSKLPRAGIIHRLDKDTTGLLIIAKTPAALKELSAQMKARQIKRVYQAIIFGTPTSGGTIDAPIGRHPISRKRMAVSENGKPAITHYRLIEKYRAHTRVKVFLETGRTHQIRVHFAHIRYPLAGDQVYGGRLQIPKGASPELIEALRAFKHQALHAYELEFAHPITQKSITCQAPLPQDLQQLISVLKNDFLSST